MEFLTVFSFEESSAVPNAPNPLYTFPFISYKTMLLLELYKAGGHIGSFLPH